MFDAFVETNKHQNLMRPRLPDTDVLHCQKKDTVDSQNGLCIYLSDSQALNRQSGKDFEGVWKFEEWFLVAPT